MFSVYGKENLFKSDRGEGGNPPPPSLGYMPENIQTVPQKATEIQYTAIELCDFFVGQSVFCIIIEIGS